MWEPDKGGGWGADLISFSRKGTDLSLARASKLWEKFRRKWCQQDGRIGDINPSPPKINDLTILHRWG